MSTCPPWAKNSEGHLSEIQNNYISESMHACTKMVRESASVNCDLPLMWKREESRKLVDLFSLFRSFTERGTINLFLMDSMNPRRWKKRQGNYVKEKTSPHKSQKLIVHCKWELALLANNSTYIDVPHYLGNSACGCIVHLSLSPASLAIKIIQVSLIIKLQEN